MAKSNKLLIGGLILGGSLLWWRTFRTAAPALVVAPGATSPGFSNPSVSYLMTWAANHNDQNWIDAIAKMSPQEQSMLGVLLQQYWQPNVGLTVMTPADGAAWVAITSKYGIT